MAFYSHTGYQGEGFSNPEDEDRFRSATGKGSGGAGLFWGSGVGPGEYYQKDGYTYKTVGGVDPNQPGWGSKVEPGWELVGYDSQGAGGHGGGFGILRRKDQAASAPASAPAAAAQAPKREVDQAKVDEAFNRAAAFQQAAREGMPKQDFSKNPYERAGTYGRELQDYLVKQTDAFKASASADATAIGETVRSAIGNFNGAVPKYDDPSQYWEKYLKNA